MIVAGTGHRPPRLGGYSEELDELLTKLIVRWLKRHPEVEKVISGMAQGWDKALVKAAIKRDIPYIAAVPFDGQESRWPQEHQDEFRALLRGAERVEVVCPGPYASWKFLRRDEWMVDNSDKLLALYDGSEFGGTAHTVAYARRKEMPMVNLWSKYLKLRQQ